MLSIQPLIGDIWDLKTWFKPDENFALYLFLVKSEFS